MNMFARFDENPAMTLRVIKETKRYGRTDARTDRRTDNVKTVYPLQTKFAGGIKIGTSLVSSSDDIPKSEWQRRWSACLDGQAGLRLCCWQTAEDRFSRVEAQLIY